MQVNDPFNAADFLAIFRTTTEDLGFVPIRNQAKDWFLDTSNGTNVLVDWHKYDKSCPTEVTLSSGMKVPIFSLLFMANPPMQQGVTCRPRDGIVTIRSMRSWLPTAAHAIQSFALLREVFSWDPEDQDKASKSID